MRKRSLKELLLISWLIPMLGTILGGCILALGLSYLDYSNFRRVEQNRLEEIAPTVGRRVVAELLLGEQGTLGPVVSQLKSEYGFSTLEMYFQSPENKGSTVRAEWPIPGDKDGRILVIERETKAFPFFIQIRHFLLALLPTALLAAFGFLLQRRFLRIHFIAPVEALAEISVGERPTDKTWPLEIQEIAGRLSEAFSSREQAVFGQVARGIIHDIRTNLHSMGTATQLVEATKDPEIREARLEKLYSACSRNIPKIRSIVDLSLDTSREIAMQPKLLNVNETVNQALNTLEEMAQAKGVKILNEMKGNLVATHDPIQMERVLVNLVRNAIEATAETQAEKRVVIGALDEPNRISIVVEDSGAGLPNPSSIFRPLKSSKVHGVGLGLFVSRKIVEAHRGKLEPSNSSSLGGAKFTVTLPKEESL